jgi:PPOX class probable F420-dependent enzyme
MSVPLSDTARRILDGKNFAVVATVNEDGSPHTSVVWVDRRDDDTIVFSSTTIRRKVRNIAREPRVSLSIFDLSDPYTAVDIRGTAELIPDPDKQLPDELGHKYLGQDFRGEPEDVDRVVVRITPEKLTSFST